MPSPLSLVRQSIAEHSITDEERQLEQLRITPEKALPPLRFLFQIFGKPCFPRGELVAVTGKAKSGKTLFNSILMASCACGKVLNVERPPDEEDDAPLRCLWYDTEQSEQSTQDILKNRILRMIEATSPQSLKGVDGSFDVFNVRSLNYEERLRLFETAVHKYRPSLVVLDGVRDLIADINDGVKAQQIVEQLMRLAQECSCCLVCVLHQNKGAEDRNLRGWVGTELMNKAFEVYACEKVKPENIFVVEQTHTRKYDLGELMFFRMDEDTELPVTCEAPTRYAETGFKPSPTSERLPYMTREYLTFDENNRPHPKTEELFYEALKAGPLYYSDLQAKVQSLLKCGTKMWNSMFCDMRDRGALLRTRNSEGKAVWTLAATAAQRGTVTTSQPDLFEQIEADIKSKGLSP